VSTRQIKTHTQLGRTAVQIFAANERMNQMLIEHLDPRAWKAKPPGKVRPIVAIFTHMHNVRAKWIRLTAGHLKVPHQLHRTNCTPKQARAALAVSAARCEEMLGEALGTSGGRIEKFHRDGWAKPWPVGVEMLCYMLSRSTPPRPGLHARASARISVADRGDVRPLELGKAVERMRFAPRPGPLTCNQAPNSRRYRTRRPRATVRRHFRPHSNRASFERLYLLL
jgi:hypothetical protein